MPSENKTPFIGLNQWDGNEYPKRQDFVNDNAVIDAELKRQDDARTSHKAESANKAHGGVKICNAILNDVQSVPNNSWYTIPFDATLVDDLGFWSPTNPTRLTIPKGVSKVKVGFSVAYATSSTGVRLSEILKNGSNTVLQGKSNMAGINVQSSWTTYEFGLHSVLTYVLNVSEGEYFEIRTRQNSGGALDLRTSVTSFYIEVIE